MAVFSTPRLLFATVASARHRRLDRRLIGFTRQREAEPVTAEMIQAYAAATDDPDPRYRGPEAMAPPFLISRLVLPLLQEALFDPRLRLNVLRMVHAGQQLRWVAPVHVGDRLRLQLTVSDIQQTAAGELLVLTGEARRDGEVVGSAATSLMVRRLRLRRGKAPKRPRPTASPTPRGEAFRLQLPTAPDQAQRYAAASGDHNFIHTSPLLARLAGLPGVVMHGMCVMAMACGAITRAHLDRAALGCARGRFSHLVQPGERLVIAGYRAADGIAFEVLNGDEKPVLREGWIGLRETVDDRDDQIVQSPW